MHAATVPHGWCSWYNTPRQFGGFVDNARLPASDVTAVVKCTHARAALLASANPH